MGPLKKMHQHPTSFSYLWVNWNSFWHGLGYYVGLGIVLPLRSAFLRSGNPVTRKRNYSTSSSFFLFRSWGMMWCGGREEERKERRGDLNSWSQDKEIRVSCHLAYLFFFVSRTISEKGEERRGGRQFAFFPRLCWMAVSHLLTPFLTAISELRFGGIKECV